MFKNAKWISRQPKPYSLTAPAPYIRKSFTLDSDIASATLAVCAVGYGVCRINGKDVTEDVLTTPVSNYDKSVYYNVYDVTHLLDVGKNAIGFILGNGAYNDNNDHWGMSSATWRDLPKVIAKLTVIYKNGNGKTVVTDKSFKTHNSPTLYNNARCGEEYDARLRCEGWDTPDFDDSAWDRAVIKPGPGGELKQNIIPPIRRIREISPKHLSGNVYDLSENISGWVKFKVRGNAGDTVRVVYAEKLNPDGTINNENENELIRELSRIQSDNYILSGGDTEEWEPKFTYHGFRYFTLETNAELVDVKGVLAHTDLEKVGDFSCSDEMLNKIHAATVSSIKTCYHSIPEDCPQREQQGWTGDAVVSAEQSLLNFDMSAAYTQWINDFGDAQRPNGALPCINPCPGMGWCGAWEGGPSWDGALIMIPYYVYKNTGDLSLIQQHFDKFVRYLDFLETVSDGYIVNFGLGDWNPPSRKRINHSITGTCDYHTLAVTTAECAKLTGRDPAPFYELADKIKRSYRERFINSDNPDMNTQTAIACGLYHGMYYDSETADVAKRLAMLVSENGYHIDCGCLGTKAIFTVLSEAGYDELLYKMVTNPTAPSYAYFINCGMTTLCERWWMDASHNHHYFSEVDHWFYKYLAGIQLYAGEIVIEPHFIDSIQWLNAYHRNIRVSYDSENITVEVPKEATLILDKKHIRLSAGVNKISRKEH